VGVPVKVLDARLVMSVITVSKTERTLATFSVDTIFGIVKVTSTVPVVRTGKVGVPVDARPAVSTLRIDPATN
jgi:hypothetical protein